MAAEVPYMVSWDFWVCFRDIVLLWGERESPFEYQKKREKNWVNKVGFLPLMEGVKVEKKKKNNWGEMRTIMGKQKLKKRRRWCKV
jgi:hypothetical protein